MAQSASFDVIVIGVGSMGSAACNFLARRGLKVLGIDQFDAPHEQGSHTGQSRIIRKAYFEHPDYVPLLEAAYRNWQNLESELGTKLFYRTGVLYMGSPSHELIKGVKRSAELYNIPLVMEKEIQPEMSSRFKTSAGTDLIFEPDAGFLIPEKAISVNKQVAIKYGATLHSNEKVLEWQREREGFRVVSPTGNYYCDKLIITTGAWAGKIVPTLKDKITVTRQYVAWMRPKKDHEFLLGDFPCWMIADDRMPGCCYGFPVLPSEFGEPFGMKLAYHYPATVTDPDKVHRGIVDEDKEIINFFIDKYFPAAFASFVASKTCLYANSPDENFIIDLLPDFDDKVAIAAGFSGHGFKFSSVIGEIVADLIINGKTNYPIDFLRLKRFRDATN